MSRRISALLVIALSMWLTACARPAPTARACDEDARQENGVLKRAQVEADITMWQRSRLDELYKRRAPDIYSPEYRKRDQQYRTLRSGPAYAKEVRRELAAMCGEDAARRLLPGFEPE